MTQLFFSNTPSTLPRWRAGQERGGHSGLYRRGGAAGVFQLMDAANVDLKAFTEEFYNRLCTGRLGAVLETLEYLKHRTKIWFEITTLLIPGHNDSPEEMKKLSEWVMTNLGLHFTAFHPD
jgi:pyruvate formate lyase activating enzyme